MIVNGTGSSRAVFLVGHCLSRLGVWRKWSKCECTATQSCPPYLCAGAFLETCSQAQCRLFTSRMLLQTGHHLLFCKITGFLVHFLQASGPYHLDQLWHCLGTCLKDLSHHGAALLYALRILTFLCACLNSMLPLAAKHNVLHLDSRLYFRLVNPCCCHAG